jgi:hypothetical protein
MSMISPIPASTLEIALMFPVHSTSAHAAETPEERAGWRSAEIALDDFVYQLTASDIAELDAVLATLRARGLSYLETDESAVALPKMEAVLDGLYREVRDGSGFIMFRGIPVQRYTKDEVRAVAWTLATRFGRPVSQNAKGAMIADVMDVIKGASSPRGYHSNAELRLHTDPASDLIGLCCIEAAKEGGDSVLANAVAIHDEMRESHPELLQALYDGFPYHRFGEGLAGDPDITDYRVPLLSVVDGMVSCRYGNNRIDGAAKALGTALSEIQKKALAEFSRIAGSDEFSLHFVDNDDPARPRHLLRFWLAGRDFRPVRKELNFFNRGECGILAKEQP